MTVPSFKPGEVMHAVCEWSPVEPSGLSTQEWAQYRTGRNHAVAAIAAELGVSIAVLDL